MKKILVHSGITGVKGRGVGERRGNGGGVAKPENGVGERIHTFFRP